MNGFFGRQYSADDLRRFAELNSGGAMMSMISTDGMHTSTMIGGQTLDEIINQNNKELRRRQSAQQFNTGPPDQESDNRRASMLEFGSGDGGELATFQFDPSPGQDNMAMGRNGNTSSGHGRSGRGKRPSTGELALNTRFTNISGSYGAMPPDSSYETPMDASNSLNLDVAGTYSASSLPIALDFSNSPLQQVASGDLASMEIYTHNEYQQGLPPTAMHPSFPGMMHGPPEDPGGGNTGMQGLLGDSDTRDQVSSGPISAQSQNRQNINGRHGVPIKDNSPTLQRDSLSEYSRATDDPLVNQNGPVLAKEDKTIVATPDETPGTLRTASTGGRPSQFQNAYSSSGFDMLSVLMRVAARPNPEINIGAVDMSCAFVVCDINQHDMPIVYCSDIFERLTGYTKHEILGRNCRFLQAPDGKVQSGVKRKYVDDASVLYLKNMSAQRKEAQISVINYRKGGQPFMNLLTMIPITWDSNEFRFFVGFQVDLVEQPNSVTNKNPDGSYAINYQRGMLPRYVFQTPENNRHQADLGQTIGRDDVSTVLSTIGTGESELSKRIWDKVLLENTDDVVHVLSLKGLFLYLSPSSRKVLEYDATELVGTALSSVCHPSDIVPVTRELKETSSGASVTVVFRIRRKQSGYTWFESHGSLHTEQGKGRKCIILVGRERPVYALARNDIIAAGGIGENELWTKMSTSGMFLYVSSNVKSLLDRQPDDLVGSSIQSLMRPESKLEFGRILEVARTGKRTAFKHEMQNKRGQVLQAHTTIYPGDAVEGQKPTFLVAQTRLLKLSRATPNTNAKAQMSPKPDQASAASTPSTTGSGGSAGQPPAQQPSTPQPAPTHSLHDTVTTQPGGSALAIGSQDDALASEENVFDELKTTRSTSWQFELRQMEKRNRLLAEELQSLLSSKKKRKRRKGAGQLQKDCANCHTSVTPEWRRGPSGNRDLCNSCGLRWAKQNGRVSPRTSSQQSDGKLDASPVHSSPVGGDVFNNNGKASSLTMSSLEKISPKGANTDSHAAKTARMEATASQGYAGGIPAKIEEGIEPL
ncbi:MAG: blue light receptor [Candelina submexicana]|nr:MAG: blue light receptor [Candelina submexicana]